jgi:hypothetical protein
MHIVEEVCYPSHQWHLQQLEAETKEHKISGSERR